MIVRVFSAVTVTVAAASVPKRQLKIWGAADAEWIVERRAMGIRDFILKVELILAMEECLDFPAWEAGTGWK